MKTFIKTAAFAVIAATLLVGPIVQAETNRTETGYAPGYGEPVKKVETRTEIKADANGKLEVPVLRQSIDAKVRAELEAALKLENERCAKLGERERRECYAQSEENFQIGLRKAFNYSQATIDAKKTLEQYEIDRKAMLEKKLDTRNDIKKTEDTKDTDKKDDDRKVFEQKMSSNFHLIYANYFKRVVANLQGIYDRISTLADRVDSRIAKLREQGIDTSVSAKLVASARTELKLGKESIDAASKAFNSEYTRPIPSVSVTNDRGVTITTGEAEYNKCVENGGKLDETNKNRCWSDDKNVYTNPTPAELVGMMAAQIRDEKTSFPQTFKYIQEAKTHFKAAHKYLAQAISNLKPGQNDDVKPTGVIKSEVNSEVKVD
jgi:hypothetical protein